MPGHVDVARLNGWLNLAIGVGLVGVLVSSWLRTADGQIALRKGKAWLEAHARASGCEGCIRRNAWIQAQANRLIWDAGEYLESEESPDGT